ncbi:MAG: antibiotic biosynthesis monooxygenase [Dysgonamonadaceae bacterium]|jgi:quinol monooxygenase YgiN|nr:antibiotic biosynthesis monooxygenase [Dysgonamonadaceae bacterium]
MIRLNVFIQVEEKNRVAVLDIAKKLVSASLADEGCIAYDIFESSTRKDVLMICETWKDEATLAAHGKKTHFTTLVPEIEALAKMKIEQFPF